MEGWQEDIKRRLEQFRHEDGNGFAVSIKVRVSYGAFGYGHSPQLDRMIDRDIEHPTHWLYVHHESGPEWLLYLALTAAGLGVAEKSLALIKSTIDLVAIAVKNHGKERRKWKQEPEPLTIVVRGFDAEGAFFEKPVIEIDSEAPPSDKTIKHSLADVIQQLAEERVRQDQSRID